MPDAVYTHGHQEAVLRSHRRRTAEDSAGYLLPRLRPGLSLLDVGCGPGTITAGLARAVAPGPVTALDSAPGVLDDARAACEAAGAGNVTFTVGDVTALDLPDGGAAEGAPGFDVVHAHQVLQHLGDPVAALREMRRVSRPGGTVAARDADYAAMTWWPRPPGMDLWLRVYRQVARGNGGEPDAGRRLLSWARAAGFSEVVPSASTWCFATPLERQWWGGLWADRTLAPAYVRMAVAGGHADTAELAEAADGWREWAAAEDGWFAVVHGEVLCRR
ncbi:methyltransferase domain-containing protein [Streptomyces lonarensis]|uniref:Methyltransferase domain-containing protein n=1 Tax=Streptomyces lonarensis TaxID=700599 RepID=A0A7X6CYZ8_9ACTN|nr:methyltransferase domain-containing protein [Streptomyces lonarensis]NJQ05157.1 methyltransferase domain-containing protein [Streptomyces lonarensis]